MLYEKHRNIECTDYLPGHVGNVGKNGVRCLQCSYTASQPRCLGTAIISLAVAFQCKFTMYMQDSLCMYKVTQVPRYLCLTRVAAALHGRLLTFRHPSYSQLGRGNAPRLNHMSIYFSRSIQLLQGRTRHGSKYYGLRINPDIAESSQAVLLKKNDAEYSATS